MSDDGLFWWAVVWGRRVVTLALLTVVAVAVVGASAFALWTLVDVRPPNEEEPRGVTPTTKEDTTVAPPAGTTQPSGGADRTITDAAGVVVGYETEGLENPDRYRETVRRAVEHWGNTTRAGGDRLQLMFDPSAADPDVVVHVQENVTCEGDPEAVGCVPASAGAQALTANATVEVRLEPRPNDRLTYWTAVHELGNVFGVGHCAVPRVSVAGNCSTGPEGDRRPNATDRDSPWTTRPWAASDDGEGAETELRVYIDTSGYTGADRGRAVTQVQRALDYYERTATAEGVGPVQFTRVTDPYRADIRIDVSNATLSCTLPDACRDEVGVTTDGDGALERYAYAHLEISKANPRWIGWQTGRELGYLLGADDPSEMPPAFRDPGAVDTGGDWWTDESETD